MGQPFPPFRGALVLAAPKPVRDHQLTTSVVKEKKKKLANAPGQPASVSTKVGLYATACPGFWEPVPSLYIYVQTQSADHFFEDGPNEQFQALDIMRVLYKN